MASAVETPAAACVREFAAWREVRKNNLSAYYLPESAPGSLPETSVFMCKYWLKVRASPAFSRVGRVMLWWLSFPPGTADLERDFCGLTMITRDFRRNRLGAEMLRVSVMAHCHKRLIEAELANEVQVAAAARA